MEQIVEGSVKFFASKDTFGKISKKLEVFYNPVMRFNRDVSILLLNALDMKDIQIADILAGSGIRSLRFAKELKKGIAKKIFANDYDANFIETFNKNVEINHLNKSIFEISNKDANIFLLLSSGFDYIDIDPFGSPNDFLESSIVRLSRRGVLAVTATDTAALCGTYSDACKRKYWAKPINNYLMHEIGIRILARKIQMIGANYDKALIPIYSFSRDHYLRIFFKCAKGKKAVDMIMRMHKFFLYCKNCMSTKISEVNHESCAECNNMFEYYGPIYAGKILDEKLSEDIAQLASRSEDKKFLEILALESTFHEVGFQDIHSISKGLKINIPNYNSLIAAIKKTGYCAYRTHFTPYGIKTDIPIKELRTLLGIK